MCFVCFLGEIQWLCHLSFSSWLFSHLSFHLFTIQDLWGLFLWPVSLCSRKEASLWIPISCHAVKLHLGDSVRWTIIECLCNLVFRRCWLLNSRGICIFTLWVFPVIRKLSWAERVWSEETITVVPPYLRGLRHQDPQLKPGPMDSTGLYMDFFCTYITMIKFNL